MVWGSDDSERILIKVFDKLIWLSWKLFWQRTLCYVHWRFIFKYLFFSN